MDDLDREILGLLRRDARTPYTEIAEKVGTSEGTVRNRVQHLVEEGVIERFTVATRTGNVRGMIELDVDVNVRTRELSARLAEWDAVDFARPNKLLDHAPRFVPGEHIVSVLINRIE
mgnify:CR=1 FL=1